MLFKSKKLRKLKETKEELRNKKDLEKTKEVKLKNK